MKEWTTMKLPSPFVSLLHRGSCVGWLCQLSAYLQREKEKKDLDELLRGKVLQIIQKKIAVCHIFRPCNNNWINIGTGRTQFLPSPVDGLREHNVHLYLSTLLSQFKHNLMIFVVPAALQDATSCLKAIKAHTGLGELRNQIRVLSLSVESHVYLVRAAICRKICSD